MTVAVAAVVGRVGSAPPAGGAFLVQERGDLGEDALIFDVLR
jgi:hypothetical protein